MTDSPHNNNNVVVREGSSGRIFRWENLQDSEKTRFNKYLSDQNLTTRDHLDHFIREPTPSKKGGWPALLTLHIELRLISQPERYSWSVPAFYLPSCFALYG